MPAAFGSPFDARGYPSAMHGTCHQSGSSITPENNQSGSSNNPQNTQSIAPEDETALAPELEQPSSRTITHTPPTGSEQVQPPPGEILLPVRHIVSKIRASNILLGALQAQCQRLKVGFLHPRTDTKTQWNSTHEMINRTFPLKALPGRIIPSEKEPKHLRLRTGDWSLLEDLRSLLGIYPAVMMSCKRPARPPRSTGPVMHTSRVSSPGYSASRGFVCLETASLYSSPTRSTRLLPQLIFHCATVFYAPRRQSRVLARRPHSPTTLDSPRARLAASCASLDRPTGRPADPGYWTSMITLC
jgi:hypothetical protein